MLKHTQTFADELSVFDHFVGLTLKVSNTSNQEESLQLAANVFLWDH